VRLTCANELGAKANTTRIASSPGINLLDLKVIWSPFEVISKKIEPTSDAPAAGFDI